MEQDVTRTSLDKGGRRRAGPNLRLSWRLLFAIVGLCLLVFCLAIASVDRARWRDGRFIGTILFNKATGRMSDIGWSDIQWVLRADSGVNLQMLADHPNPFAFIASPRRSATDVAAGELLFRNLCSSCHGVRATGDAGGPSLVNRSFQQGRSDWALYRTITLGVPGTAMVGHPLPRDDVWRLVSYLSHLMAAQPAEAITSPSKPAPASFEPVTPDELRAADDHPADWLTYSGSYAGHRYSRLRQINRDNVGQLRLEWARQFTTTAERVETSPIVRGSVMFVTEPPNSVQALDAATGRVLWTYARDLPSQLRLCCGTGNRGVALLGNRVFVGTLDAHLIALDAGTGRVLWDVPVAEYSSGYSITGAPLAIDGMVVTGVANGEFGNRGFIDAYDAASGERRWRFYTVPAAGEPGSETWQGSSLTNGGAPTWVTGSFDPESRLLYWGVGNASPDFYSENRPGDNLYSNSVAALDVDTGKLRWYFQFTPHDAHDWDATQVPVLIDGVVDGLPRKLLVTANRNGFYYVLDRITGEFLLGTPFVRQTWTDGLDAKGRPRVRPESVPTQQGSTVYPNVSGGTNWRSPSFDPELGLFFVPATDRGSIFFTLPKQPVDRNGLVLMGTSTPVPDEDMIVAVKAVEATTGRLRWQYTRPPRRSPPDMGGLTSTAGHIVFGADLETLFALDADTGAELWHIEAGGLVLAAPVTYELADRQYVAVAAGHSILAFTLPAWAVQSGSPSAVH